eukprot:5020903-Alexandrium_andersonii.AAC.1
MEVIRATWARLERCTCLRSNEAKDMCLGGADPQRLPHHGGYSRQGAWGLPAGAQSEGRAQGRREAGHNNPAGQKVQRAPPGAGRKARGLGRWTRVCCLLEQGHSAA